MSASELILKSVFSLYKVYKYIFNIKIEQFKTNEESCLLSVDSKYCLLFIWVPFMFYIEFSKI